VDLPNPLISQWHLLLKNVSFSSGVLNLHVPEDSSVDVAGLKSPYRLRVVHSPLDWAACSSVETRTVTHVFPGWAKNAFLSNAGHFNINILIPLFRYLFFVHNQLPNLVDGGRVPHNQLPLPNTLLLFKSEGALSTPVFMFDVVLRFAESYTQFGDYFASLGSDGATHCFDSIDVPIFDPVDHANPQTANPPLLYGLWDSMIYSLKGRWGNHDFYFNFWRNVKHQIWQLYDMMPADSEAAAATLSHDKGNATDKSPVAKPKLAFMVRAGKAGSRTDGNVHDVSSVLGQAFDVTEFGSHYYRWHADNDSLRFQQTRNTLLKVQQMDVMLGQGGSNNQLALFLREGRMVVEMKIYLPCHNEAARNLANHNRLAFHILMLTSIATVAKNVPVQYSRAGLEKLSAELAAAWRANVDGSAHESRLDAWPATCDFLWPHEDPSIRGRATVMTRANVSRCYLEQVPSRAGQYYQLTTHKNSLLADCFAQPADTVVRFCMTSGVC
jgi:hypothetical protein